MVAPGLTLCSETFLPFQGEPSKGYPSFRGVNQGAMAFSESQSISISNYFSPFPKFLFCFFLSILNESSKDTSGWVQDRRIDQDKFDVFLDTVILIIDFRLHEI